MRALGIIEDRLSTLTPDVRRELREGAGIDFSSNDYLGFAHDEVFRREIAKGLEDVPAGSTGSRLLRGHSQMLSDIEANLADFVGREAALMFPSGYQANLALISALLKPGDAVFSDRCNHASLIDGMRISKAKKVVFNHNDVDHLEDLLKKKSSKGLNLVVTESIFSMEGDLSPLKDLAFVCQKHSAGLVVDESHATGFSGPGRVFQLGLRDRVLASVHTGGKALGVSGAWVAGGGVLKQYLVNFARPLIFSTAPSPVVATVLDQAVRYWKRVGPYRASSVLKASVDFQKKIGIKPNKTPIVSLVAGSNQRALEMAGDLFERGFDIRAIRPPTVPPGSARLRITVNFKNLKHLCRLQENILEICGV